MSEIVDATPISPSLARALILARDRGTGLATFDPQAAIGAGILPPQEIFQI
jgi:hypothetical protein